MADLMKCPRLRAEYEALKGEKKHYCPEWDFLPIDETCPEFEVCRCFPRNADAIKVQPWDLVKLKNHTDLYRVYSYRGHFLFVGQNSDTIRTEFDAEVTEVIQRDEDAC